MVYRLTEICSELFYLLQKWFIDFLFQYTRRAPLHYFVRELRNKIWAFFTIILPIFFSNILILMLKILYEKKNLVLQFTIMCAYYNIIFLRTWKKITLFCTLILYNNNSDVISQYLKFGWHVYAYYFSKMYVKYNLNKKKKKKLFSHIVIDRALILWSTYYYRR